MNSDTSSRVARDSYAISGGEEGKRRLDLLAEVMRPTTTQLFDEVGVGSGQACLDVGCGGGHVSLALAEIVGPTGRVTGVDVDHSIVQLARLDAAAAGMENVVFLTMDARAVEGGPFDLIYARFLLSHVLRPEEVLEHLATLLAEGGALVVEDIDFSRCFCHPADRAFDRFLEFYAAVVGAGGGDVNLGQRLPELLNSTGLRDVGWNAFQPVHGAGPYKRLQMVTMERIGPALLRDGLATAQEIEEILAGMREFADDPGTVVAMPRMVQAWGRA